jgi:hypothetical protein
MPYFDWKATPGVSLQVASHERYETELCVALSGERLGELHQVLEQVFVQAEAELRVDFPGNWTLYWKARDGESRILLAHPEREEWVGTVAWAHGSVAALLQGLGSLKAGSGDLVLSELDRLSSFSNLNLRIRKNENAFA